LIYLTGGQASVLLNRLQRSGVDKLLKDYPGVIVGRSAGAMALGKGCLVTNRYSGNRKVILGLGLTDFSFNVHYDSSKDDLLKGLSKNGKIYAIPQGAAVVFRGGHLSFVGAVFLFKDGQKTTAS
jgi:peptidase E